MNVQFSVLSLHMAVARSSGGVAMRYMYYQFYGWRHDGQVWATRKSHRLKMTKCGAARV